MLNTGRRETFVVLAGRLSAIALRARLRVDDSDNSVHAKRDVGCTAIEHFGA
jgi:hypothetical protein